MPPGRPLLVSTLRALPVGLLLLLIFRQLPKGVWWWRILLLGLLNFGLFFALLFYSAYRLPGGVAATFNAVQPFVVTTLAWLFLNEKMTWKTIVAATLGLAGVALIVLGPTARVDFWGVVAGATATLFMGIATILIKAWGRPAPLLVFTSWQLIVGGLMLLPATLVFEGLPAELTSTNILAFTYIGIVATAIAYSLWFRGLQRLKASTVTFLALLSPVAAMLVDYFIVHRALTIIQIGGALLVLAGIVLAQFAQRGLNRESDTSRELHVTVA
jgi:probable blue pigment (indigoidine) exporter